MTNFIDHTEQVKKQTFDMAVITDASGRKVGKIVIRYTPAVVGANTETGILFNAGADESQWLNFGKTEKNDATNTSFGVYNLLSSIGAKVYGHNMRRFYTYADKPKPMPREAQNIDSLSRPTEIQCFKLGNRRFNILWV